MFSLSLASSGHTLDASHAFGIAVVSGGENGLFTGRLKTQDGEEQIDMEGDSMLGQIMAGLCELQETKQFDYSDSPLLLSKPRECDCSGCEGKRDPILVTSVQVENKVILTLDGAAARKACRGKCGPPAKLPCHICGACNTQKDGSNYGMCYELVSPTADELLMPLGAYSERHGYSFEHLAEAHDPAKHAELKTFTCEGIHSVKSDERQPVVMAHGAFTEDDTVADVIAAQKRRRGNIPLFRVRLIWPTEGEHTRPLKDCFKTFKWLDIVMCSLHCCLRSTEWLIFNTIRTRDEDVTLIAVEEQLHSMGCPVTLQYDDAKLQKPTIHAAKAEEWWFEAGTSGRPRYEELVEVTDGRNDTLDVWHAYAALRVLLLAHHPTIAQQKLINPLSFEYFLRFRQRWKGVCEVHHYLHQCFGHAPAWMAAHRSIGAWRNEEIEKLHAVDKHYIQNKTPTLGFGKMLYEHVIQKYMLDVWYYAREGCAKYMGLADNADVPTMDWQEFTAESFSKVPCEDIGDTDYTGGGSGSDSEDTEEEMTTPIGSMFSCTIDDMDGNWNEDTVIYK